MNDAVLRKLRDRFPDAIVDAAEFRDELTVTVKNERLVEICTFLRDDADCAFNLLADACGIDMFTPVSRFGVVYNLYSITRKHRIRLKTFTEESDPVVPTVTGVWPTANWHERETFDMFGISFSGHPDLRRIYMSEDFEYHPLRKDFPLMGVPGSMPLPKK